MPTKRLYDLTDIANALGLRNPKTLANPESIQTHKGQLDISLTAWRKSTPQHPAPTINDVEITTFNKATGESVEACINIYDLSFTQATQKIATIIRTHETMDAPPHMLTNEYLQRLYDQIDNHNWHYEYMPEIGLHVIEDSQGEEIITSDNGLPAHDPFLELAALAPQLLKEILTHRTKGNQHA